MQSPATRYIDKQTRAIFLVMTVYNPNYNTFCYIQLLVEFSAGGALGILGLGLLADVAGYPVVFVVAGLATFLALGVLLRSPRKDSINRR